MTDVNTAPDGWQRPELEDNAESVLQERYYLKDENGRATEDASGLFYRVAKAIGGQENGIGNKADWTIKFYDLMASRRFLPNSPCLMNAGKKQKGWNQMAACFVLPIEDSLISIADTHRAALLIHQSGGGTGFNFSRIRPKGSYVRGSSGVASGPVSFMSMIDHSCGIVKQGGTRRGANMGILNVDHPDILDFITCKSEDGEIENFNISVGISDRFMEAVERDGDWNLNSMNGDDTQFVLARALWDKIIHGAWLNGEPGAIFLDELDRDNPVKHIGNIDTTNPCGEIGLLPYEACVLGSINIAEHYDAHFNEVNYDNLREDIYTAIRFLDNMIDASEFPLEEIDEIVKRGNRRLGLGVMGWADLLLKMKIKYGSEESINLARNVAWFVNRSAMRASESLAMSRGVYGNSVATESIPRRNVEVTAIAPTGTISMIAGCSSGIEPIFAFKFVKSVMENVETGEKHNLEYVHPEYAKLNPNEVTPDWFVDAGKVTPREHVLMQAAWQKHIGNAVSKTINLPSDATIDDVAEAYILAWKTKCKGITVYRDGSRSGQVLTEVKTDKATEPVEPVETVVTEFDWMVQSDEVESGTDHLPFVRPVVADSRTTKINNGCGSNYISVSFDENGKPFEIFSTLGKTGGCGSAQNESIGRMASLALRNGATIEDVIRHLRGIQCNRPVGFGDNRVLSCGDGISQALERIMGKRPSTVIPVSDLQESGQHEELPMTNRVTTTTQYIPMGCCPSCEGSNLNHESGCITCMECGWSECG